MDIFLFYLGDDDVIFVTLPRMKPGIPATLGTVSSEYCDDGSPKVEPYPDWSWHKEDNCEGLVSVFRTKVTKLQLQFPFPFSSTNLIHFLFQVDDCGRIWIIDSGVIDVLNTARRICPPKLMVFDLKTKTLMLKYIFPDDVLEHDSLLVTIAVDNRSKHCRDTFAYIADVTEYGLIVFDSRNHRSWRVNSNYFYPYPIHGTFNVGGSQFDLMDGVIGLALSPVDKFG